MGSATAINMAMIAITIISSMKVKPKRRRLTWGTSSRTVALSPGGVRCSIARLVHALAVHIKYVLTAPGLRRRIVAVAAQPPFIRIGHGVFRDAAQVFHL